MAKTYTAAGGGFTRIEATLRDAANNYRNALEDIDEALAAKRTPEEAGFLGSLRAAVSETHSAARAVAGKFISVVPIK